MPISEEWPPARLQAMSVIDLINAAQELESQERGPDSVSLYRAWVVVNDTELAFAAHFNLGVLLMKSGLLGEAEKAFRAAITRRRGFLDAHQMLSTLLESVGRADDARQHWFEMLQSTKPVTTGEYELVALAAAKTRKYAESMEQIHIGWIRSFDVPAEPAVAGSVASTTVHLPDSVLDATPVNRRYVVVAPPFEHNSAGIRVLYELQKWLVRSGLDAIVCTWFNGYPVSQFEEDIVIYPEVAPGNLLKAKRVVRYILNVPGKLGYGEKTFSSGERLVAYNQELASYSNGAILQVPSIEPFFNSEQCHKTVDAVFVGKGKDLGLHPKHCIPITKGFPATRREVAGLLRSVKTLYMYDDFSMIYREAQLCGCDVRLIRSDGQITDYPRMIYPSADEFQAQLRDFIAMTKTL